MKDNSILILGGAGFLGRAIVNKLSKLRIKFCYGDLQPIKGFEKYFIKIDLLSPRRLNNLNIEYDLIINLSGQITSPSNLCFRLNSSGINHIIEYINKKDAKLIQVSTLSIFGSSDNTIFENSSINPETSYGACKAMAEFLIQNFIPSKNYCLLRLPNLYGENQLKGLIAYLLKSVKYNNAISFNNDGTLIRHLMHVSDASDMIIHFILDYHSGKYNFAGNESYSIKELVNLFEEVFRRELIVHYTNVNAWENISDISSEEIISLFGDTIKYNLRDWLMTQNQN